MRNGTLVEALQRFELLAYLFAVVCANFLVHGLALDDLARRVIITDLKELLQEIAVHEAPCRFGVAAPYRVLWCTVLLVAERCQD